MSQSHHTKRFDESGRKRRAEGEKKKKIPLLTKRQQEDLETEEEAGDDDEDESLRFKYSMSQFASQNQRKSMEVICEVCGNAGLENFAEDQQTGSYFCKRCNTKTDALVIAPDAEALARSLPGFREEQGSISFHGGRRRRVGFGARVKDYSQQFTEEERMVKEKRALRIEERKFTKMVDLHCETMTKLLRAQCEYCVKRYVRFSSSANDDENEKEREIRRREKRANEFRKACRSVWFALLAAKDELFSIDMDDIRSVNDALGTSTYVLDVRKLKNAKREAIAEARQQKTMLAYSDEGDDDNDDEAREDGGEEENAEDERDDDDDDDDDEGDEDDDAEDTDGGEDKNVNTKNAKSLKAGAEEETKHLSAVNSLIMAHLPQKLTLGALFVATRMCFSNEESFGFTFARDISTLASTGKLPYLRPTTNIYHMRAWGKDLLRPRTMPTSTDVMQMAEYIVAKTGLDEHIIFGRGVLNHTRELVHRTFQSSFPAFLKQQKLAEAIVVAKNDENMRTKDDDDNSESKTGRKTAQLRLSRVADAYCESAENLMQFLGYDFLLDEENHKCKKGRMPQISIIKEADAHKILSSYPAEVHASAIIVVTLKLLFGLDGRVKSVQRKRTTVNHIPDCVPVDERENSALKIPAEGWLVWATNARKAFQEELLRKRYATPPNLPNGKRKDDAKDVNAYIDWCEANVFDDATKKISGRFKTMRDKLCKIAAGGSVAKKREDNDYDDGEGPTSLSQLLKEEKRKTEDSEDDDDDVEADVGAQLYEVSVNVPFTKGKSDRASPVAKGYIDGDDHGGESKYAGSFVQTHARIDLNAPEFIAILNWASEVCGANFNTTHRCVMILERLLLLEDNNFLSQIKSTWKNVPRSVLKERKETKTTGKRRARGPKLPPSSSSSSSSSPIKKSSTLSRRKSARLETRNSK